MDAPLVGVLALQGDFEAHGRLLRELGAQAREVRVPRDLEGLDALVMPGGESTTMTLGIEREGLADPLRDFVRSGKPVLGTCAGMIMLDREHLALADYTCRRNAFGRQIRSFEADLRIPGIDGPPVRAVFIRAPWIADAGERVEILASVDGHPVAARQDNMLVISFHPEIAGERRVHELFLTQVGGARLSREFFFVRHGESAANVFDRGGAQPDDGGDRLTEHGRAQARGVAERLRGEAVETIVASPMGRAQETAAAIGEALDLPVSTDDDLFEVVQSDAYHASRSTRGEHASLAWMPDAPPDESTPGAESFADITSRISRARARLEAIDAERVLVVSHHDVLHFLLGLIMFEDAFAPGHLPGLYRLRHANTGISIFTYDDERVMDGIPLPGWSLTTWNDRAHL